MFDSYTLIINKSTLSNLVVKVEVTGLQTGQGDVKHGLHVTTLFILINSSSLVLVNVFFKVHATGIKNTTDDVSGSKTVENRTKFVSLKK